MESPDNHSDSELRPGRRSEGVDGVREPVEVVCCRRRWTPAVRGDAMILGLLLTSEPSNSSSNS